MDDAVERLTTELIRHLRLTTRAKAALIGAEPGSADPSALLLLPPLVHTGPLRVTDLAELKQADPSTVSRQAAQLVKAGLARREPDPADGRASRLAATPAGEAACARLVGRRRALIGAALADWPAEAVAAFAAQFEQFNTAMEQLLRTGGPTPPADDRENP
ncbi:MarR family winged helix-turn-helix transcriptional regulator [Spirilliplanes yamanashiensis]|uniref:Transcriptional regulator n=1 Tax=Spirilliplanes yamanashiensis TaxID=42233 RepID=A0A8J4DLY6_9ACTN|nr:MarR family transcriptional regulator [Spirilliplanes yamanashiensis]MDP9816351.1 DNA-binding MarR family transcriptional regulator [Spirilliplanes yamanashiensis]GIJ05878.1 transcriptional regulator [Spirilliplanes yamanashiensis]